MAGLPDLSPSETVMVGGEPVPVCGVSLKVLMQLFKRFPELTQLFGGGKELDTARLIEMGDSVVSAIIAAGIGYPDDKKQESLAGKLPLEVQLDLIGAIIRVTMPGGVGPFVEKLGMVTGTLGVEQPISTSSKPVAAPLPEFPPGADVTRVKRSSRHLDA